MMTVQLWGTRGSVASAGPETAGYGGDTASVAVHGPERELIVLDAGSGIRRGIVGAHAIIGTD